LSDERLVLAFDLGGTRLKAGIVDVTTGTVLARRTVDTPVGADAALALLARVGRELLQARAPVEAVGLCVPGLVDQGRIFALPGKLAGIVGVHLSARLQIEFGREAIVINDALAFGLGEVAFGAARAAHRVVVMTIGTGVGVAVFEAGRPLGDGPLGAGTLGGQIPVFEDETGPTDTNGKRGTIEARCAAVRIVEVARGRGVDVDDVAGVYARAALGDAAADAAIAAYCRDLGRSIVALAHAHAPSLFVLGGGPMQPTSPVFTGLAEAVRAALWPGYEVDIVAAACGDDAALLGVATHAVEELARRAGKRPTSN